MTVKAVKADPRLGEELDVDLYAEGCTFTEVQSPEGETRVAVVFGTGDGRAVAAVFSSRAALEDFCDSLRQAADECAWIGRVTQ